MTQAAASVSVAVGAAWESRDAAGRERLAAAKQYASSHCISAHEKARTKSDLGAGYAAIKPAEIASDTRGALPHPFGTDRGTVDEEVPVRVDTRQPIVAYERGLPC